MVCKKLLVVSGDDEQAVKDKSAIEEWSSEISAIAYGVEARLNLLTGFSKVVTQQSIDIAQQLDIPEKEVQRWAAARSMPDSERNRIIQSPHQ